MTYNKRQDRNPALREPKVYIYKYSIANIGMQEVIMFKDRAVIWVLEYIVGGTLVLVPLIGLGFLRANWTDVHAWATGLFVVCLGVTLISSASSMRQRMLLARRIDTLAEQMEDSSTAS